MNLLDKLHKAVIFQRVQAKQAGLVPDLEITISRDTYVELWYRASVTGSTAFNRPGAPPTLFGYPYVIDKTLIEPYTVEIIRGN